ncbi:MAG: nucleoside triphosphate pyrophosphatase [Thermoleophilaceae bacterium]|nr:nucleoside triphosphate pyrophosphatase [Thermoleophilaceae bacterium]
MPAELILASRSPQRRAILEQLGIPFVVKVPDVAENTTGEPRDVVIGNALMKAQAVEGDLVLGVDTVVVLGARIYGKPQDEAEARMFLQELSGRDHEVWSGLALVEDGAARTAALMTTVRFRELDEADLEWYLGSGEWRERAGGYAIQGRGAALVEQIDGDYSNVVGLPIPALIELAPGLRYTSAARGPTA